MLPCLLLLVKLLDDLNNPISNLLTTGVSTQILRPQVETAELWTIKDLLDSLLNEIRLSRSAEGVSEQHSSGEDGSDRVGDSLSGNVWGGTVDSEYQHCLAQKEARLDSRLVDTRDGLLRVRRTGQRGRGQKTQRTGDDGALVRQTIIRWDPRYS